MDSFGIIHELADVEIRVRRNLQGALHEVHCARAILADEIEVSLGNRNRAIQLLDEAMKLIQRVSG